MNHNPVRILKVDPLADTELEELEFELDFLASLTVAERFDLMFRRSHLMAEQLQRHGHRSATQITKRS